MKTSLCVKRVWSRKQNSTVDTGLTSISIYIAKVWLEVFIKHSGFLNRYNWLVSLLPNYGRSDDNQNFLLSKSMKGI